MKAFYIFFILLTVNLYASNEFVVLIPGAASSGEDISIRGLTPVFGKIDEGKYFKHFESELIEEGFKVLTCPKFKDKDKRDITDRAKDCSAFLLSKVLLNPRVKFHLVGHSMGGLVARKVLDYRLTARFIKSVTTISTPHKGAMFANYVYKHNKSFDPVAKFIALIQFRPEDRAYLKDLKIENGVNVFTQNLKNPKKVKIYSISNYRTNWYNAPLVLSSKVLSKEAKLYKGRSLKNDGIIETSSMVYGEHIAQIQADHLESACIMATRFSRGCKQSLSVVIEHLNSLISL